MGAFYKPLFEQHHSLRTSSDIQKIQSSDKSECTSNGHHRPLGGVGRRGDICAILDQRKRESRKQP